MMQILCVGDIAFSSLGPAQARSTPLARPHSHNDSRILFNWEIPIGQATNPVRRASGPRLIAPLDVPYRIASWSPGFATLATNHILDAGTVGLAETVAALRRLGFATVGAGCDEGEITRPLLWETAEGCVAIVNWVLPETHPDWMARPGANCWPGLAEACATIRSLKRETSWVLVAVHWSDELFPYPLPEDRRIARALAGAGADVVIGHHPHVVRGMETTGACPVFYSVGNLYFEDVVGAGGEWVVGRAPRNREGLGVELSFRRGERPQYQLMSFWDTGQEAVVDLLGRAARRMASTSWPLRKLQDASYAAWYRDQRARFDRWGGRWHFGVRRLGLRGTALRLFQKAHRTACSQQL